MGFLEIYHAALYEECSRVYSSRGMVGLRKFVGSYQGDPQDKDFLKQVVNLVGSLNAHCQTRCFSIDNSPLILAKDGLRTLGENPQGLEAKTAATLQEGLKFFSNTSPQPT